MKIAVVLLAVSTFFAGCAAPPTQAPSTQPAPPQGAILSKRYSNLFKELLGKSDSEVNAKIDAAWQHYFLGDRDTQRLYYEVEPDMAYIKDINNDDVRSEGMSYAMMIGVQLDKKKEFDRLWAWAKKYMYQSEEPYKGYFAWHCKDDGTQLDANPASDGEIWFATALFFASARWGDGQGIYNYRAEANAILDTMLHTDERSSSGVATNLFDAKTKQVVFVPQLGTNSGFTDPSYHTPAFYEIWAKNADKDRAFWKDATAASRAFFKTAAHPKTGLMPDYANFDGTPSTDDFHKHLRFDAWRVAMNVALDWSWHAADPWQREQSDRWLNFFAAQGVDRYVNQYTLDGKPLSQDRSPGLIAMNAVATLAATTDKRKDFVSALWELEPSSGQYRYYDGMLHLLGLLQVSGKFQAWSPQSK
jgi:oligosaccharide reducing-end xylanase